MNGPIEAALIWTYGSVRYGRCRFTGEIKNKENGHVGVIRRDLVLYNDRIPAAVWQLVAKFANPVPSRNICYYHDGMLRYTYYDRSLDSIDVRVRRQTSFPAPWLRYALNRQAMSLHDLIGPWQPCGCEYCRRGVGLPLEILLQRSNWQCWKAYCQCRDGRHWLVGRP